MELAYMAQHGVYLSIHGAKPSSTRHKTTWLASKPQRHAKPPIGLRSCRASGFSAQEVGTHADNLRSRAIARLGIHLQDGRASAHTTVVPLERRSPLKASLEAAKAVAKDKVPTGSAADKVKDGASSSSVEAVKSIEALGEEKTMGRARLPDGQGSARTLSRQRYRAKKERRPYLGPDRGKRVGRPGKLDIGQGSSSTLFRQRRAMQEAAAKQLALEAGDAAALARQEAHQKALYEQNKVTVATSRQRSRLRERGWSEMRIWRTLPGDARRASNKIRERLDKEIKAANADPREFYPEYSNDRVGENALTTARQRLRMKGIKEDVIFQQYPGKTPLDRPRRGRPPVYKGPGQVPAKFQPGRYVRVGGTSRVSDSALPLLTASRAAPQVGSLGRAAPSNSANIASSETPHRMLDFDLNLPPPEH
ncbi:hypothetical protein CBOM_00674 [Ceraceosorus bombacis]|uniref:Uncharacterized protein n=1 Tax=Ceraceosorus bombacis TaxID=401625 RepID=A0A0P1BAQ1_9BASI|nr:hypothetical protein CBOM_00674 [Ceraceosorus bombacis]